MGFEKFWGDVVSEMFGEYVGEWELTQVDVLFPSIFIIFRYELEKKMTFAYDKIRIKNLHDRSK